jgi:hypothetical protein
MDLSRNGTALVVIDPQNHIAPTKKGLQRLLVSMKSRQ